MIRELQIIGNKGNVMSLSIISDKGTVDYGKAPT